jgi:transposase
MLHTWRREAKGGSAPAVRSDSEFVSVPLAAPIAPAATPIRIELRHGATSVSVAWPAESADACAAWPRGLLR